VLKFQVDRAVFTEKKRARAKGGKVEKDDEEEEKEKNRAFPETIEYLRRFTTHTRIYTCM